MAEVKAGLSQIILAKPVISRLFFPTYGSLNVSHWGPELFLQEAMLIYYLAAHVNSLVHFADL